MGEKNWEKKSPSPLEVKPKEPRQVSEKTAKALGGAAIKNAGKK